MELLGEFIQKQLLTTKFSHLSSYLISPVQRLPRFILFFKDLLKNTPSDHPDHLPITQSLLSLSKFYFLFYFFFILFLFVLFLLFLLLLFN